MSGLGCQILEFFMSRSRARFSYLKLPLRTDSLKLGPSDRLPCVPQARNQHLCAHGIRFKTSHRPRTTLLRARQLLPPSPIRRQEDLDSGYFHDDVRAMPTLSPLGPPQPRLYGMSARHLGPKYCCNQNADNNNSAVLPSVEGCRRSCTEFTRVKFCAVFDSCCFFRFPSALRKQLFLPLTFYNAVRSLGIREILESLLAITIPIHGA
ncbi:hypothetical protein R3P38DRAFT_2762182 [Favolaschia claudopus]|uniref:Uncharacterized protein n=1 Tax=Favolaschia claudopus TaxID=2862362 RepID=A0AAW0DV55_9AGAR